MVMAAARAMTTSMSSRDWIFVLAVSRYSSRFVAAADAAASRDSRFAAAENACEKASRCWVVGGVVVVVVEVEAVVDVESEEVSGA